MGCYGHVVDVKTDSRLEERKFRCAERKEKNLTRGQGRAKSPFKSAFNFNFKNVTFMVLIRCPSFGVCIYEWASALRFKGGSEQHM